MMNYGRFEVDDYDLKIYAVELYCVEYLNKQNSVEYKGS